MRRIPPWPRGRIGAAAIAALLLSVAGAAGCSESADARVATGAATADAGAQADVAEASGPQVVASAQAPVADAGGAYVEIEGEWHADVQRVQIRIHIGGFPNLLGIAGHLRYDPAALALADFAGHDTPKGPPADNAYWLARTIARPSPAGRILMGGARFAHKPHPWKPIEGAKVSREPWLTAEFEVLQDGDHTIAFDPASTVARSADGSDVPVTWGSVRVLVGAAAQKAAQGAARKGAQRGGQ